MSCVEGAHESRSASQVSLEVSRLETGWREGKGPANAADAALELVLEALERGHPQRMRALGSSMWPAIPGGAWVELSPKGAAPLEPLEVVALSSRSGRFLIHRVRGVRADGAVLLMGDHCPAPDGWFSADEVMARVLRMDTGSGWQAVGLPRPTASFLRRACGRLRGALRRAMRAR